MNIEDFNVIKSNHDQWVFVLEHKPFLKIILDIDETHLQLKEANDPFFYHHFHEAIGDIPGTIYLLDALGIKWDRA